MKKDNKTTFIGICLIVITIGFALKWIDLSSFLTVFAAFTGAGFVLSQDSTQRTDKKEK